jgi:putative membrane protein
MELTIAKIKKSSRVLIPALLIILHVAGVIGMVSPWSEEFVKLTPFHLVATFLLMIWPDRSNGQTLWVFAICVMVGTFLTELAGVQTGLMFGNYSYGDVLGPSIFGTPLVIGINWFVLSYAIGITLSRLRLHPVLLSLLGAAVMTALDVLIEPVAIMLGFWDWNGPVPVQNYIAWFVIAFIILLVFNYASFRKDNPYAPLTLWLQFGFFVALNAIRLING